MHQSLQGATFHVEHILPRSRGGLSHADNLAWACPSCNLRKSDRVAGFDSESTELVLLFNPRKDQWREHFEWNGFQVVGLTPTGRVTIKLLDLNCPRRVMIRKAEELFELFPPS
jgi:hypothetical protein